MLNIFKKGNKQEDKDKKEIKEAADKLYKEKQEIKDKQFFSKNKNVKSINNILFNETN